MASKKIPLPGAARFSAATGAPSVADRPRVSLDRAVKQASIRTAERKLRQAGLPHVLQSALPSLTTARTKRAGVRAPPR